MNVLQLAQDRLKTLHDLPLLTEYFFSEPSVNMELISGNKQLAKLDTKTQVGLLEACVNVLTTLEDWRAESIQQSLNELLETTGQKPGTLFSLVRIATTWAPFSPQLNDTLELLGKDRSLARIEQSIAALKQA